MDDEKHTIVLTFLLIVLGVGLLIGGVNYLNNIYENIQLDDDYYFSDRNTEIRSQYNDTDEIRCKLVGAGKSNCCAYNYIINKEGLWERNKQGCWAE